jgi:quercetin dioxygenase-like cupin family protein
MEGVFPQPIRNLPQAAIPLQGVTAFLSQGDSCQILFMEFSQDVDLPEHAHAAQVGIVLEGRIDLEIGGERRSFRKGDRYYIPEGVKHRGKIQAGYADITFFADPDRYSVKEARE